MRKARVLLAEDHGIVAEGLRNLLENEFELVGTVGDGLALIKAAKQLKPDVIVTDISIPLLNGLEAARQLRAEQVRSKIVFLTMHGEPLLAKEAFRIGASAYLLKRSASKELITGIREALEDRRYVTPLIAEDGISFLIEADRHSERPTVSLTDRKRQVLQLIAEGRITKEIAAILNISTRTVEAHKYEMMRAFGVRTIAELVLHAIKLGLVSVPPAHSDHSQ